MSDSTDAIVHHGSKAARHAGKAAQAGWSATRDTVSTANSNLSGYISKNEGIWGAMKAGAHDHPIAALAVAGVGIWGTYHMAKGIFGSHTQRVENERYNGGQLSR